MQCSGHTGIARPRALRGLARSSMRRIASVPIPQNFGKGRKQGESGDDRQAQPVHWAAVRVVDVQEIKRMQGEKLAIQTAIGHWAGKERAAMKMRPIHWSGASVRQPTSI